MDNNFSAKKFLFVSWESLSGDLAWQIKKEGHEVKVYIRNETDQDVYDGFIEKIERWEDYVDWADAVVFDDVGFGEIADELRKKGKLVVGGSGYTDKLEDDREFGQTEMAKAGMLVLPHWDFSDFNSAIKFLQENPGRYVFKPNFAAGRDEDNHDLLFLGEEEDGKDILEIIESNKKFLHSKIKTFQLQKFASGVEIAVGAFFNGEDFIYPINVNFEHKRLFPGEIGPFTGEMGCYDKKTEVLTEDGWKYFKNLTYQDKIATLNPRTNQLEYRRPSNIVSYDHHKKMVQIKNQTIDILVTPEHNMWVQKRYQKDWQFIRADLMLSNAPKIARTANWQGKKYDENKAAFLGIYLAEGSVSKNPHGGHQVVISGANSKKTKKIQRILNKTSLNWKRNKKGWHIYDKFLYQELVKYGKSYEKYVPPEIKNADKESIKAFLDAYGVGDATVMRGGWRIFYTSSKRIADDIQELLLKIGRVGIIKERNRFNRKQWLKDHWVRQKHKAFEVIERINKIYSYLDKRNTKIVKYQGKVYCATVPSHIMYVRRKGKPYWCGNTAMYWSSPNRIFNETLLKIKERLKEANYVGYIDINCIANARGIYPLEFTSRFGYPTISIQTEGILTPRGEFLYRLANHENFELKTKKGFQIGVVVALTPYIYVSSYSQDISTYHNLSILFRRPNPNLEGIHLGDVKLVDDRLRVAGVSGYVLIVTGSGKTVEEARRQTYSRVKNIRLQNMFYRVDIGTRWYQDSDRLQSWGYL